MEKSFLIRDIKAREVLDCRGQPTIEVEVVTEGGFRGAAIVPSGRSKGSYEALEIRDGEKRYHGMGVLKAVRNVREILAPALRGKDVRRQREIDMLMIELDGTENKSRIGANAIVGVSLAVAKTAANALGIPLYHYIGGVNAHLLPIPILDLIEGGKLAATDLDFQEHQAIPVGAKTFSDAIRMGLEVYQILGGILSRKYGKYSLNVGVEGGYTPPGLKDPREAFDVILKAIEEGGYSNEFVLGLDCAATHIFNPKTGKYSVMGKELSREELIDFYKELVSAYPLRSIEDPFYEDDFEGYVMLTKALNIQVIGDDLFVTNLRRLVRGVEMGAANAVLLKVNQAGTLTEALDVAELAFKNGYNVVVSERSGQSEDTWLADLAVGINAGQIKTGVTRGERTAQYNRLLCIEEELGGSGRYAGKYFKQLIPIR